MARTPRLKNPGTAKVAVVIPCYNEAAAIGAVIQDFKKQLPSAEIHVFDNNSTDKTIPIADKNGAIIHRVTHQGKGNVVRRMFADVEADIYIMVDGDNTYHAPSVTKLIDRVLGGDDMVVGCRVEDSKDNKNYRRGHRLGNRLITGSVMRIFGGSFTDMLSGYRAFSRRYAKSFPALSTGFEIETELTVHALELAMPYSEVPTPYSERPAGSESKLSTYRDGFKILKMIIKLYAIERPLEFFGLLGGLSFVSFLIIMTPIIIEYSTSHLVPKFPSVILASSLLVIALLLIIAGIIVNALTRARREMKRLSYLSIPCPRIFE